MCGVVGIFAKKDEFLSPIQAMTDALIRRGPDAQKVYVNNQGLVALGHTRLSILDLSTQANQPFYSGDGRYVMVFNGEVYNFQAIKAELQKNHGIQFHTTSDTEVVLEAFAVWGEAMATKLEGMFALAIFDQKKNELFLLRDRVGKKPLYYYHSDELFVFASEIKALRCHPIIEKNKIIDKSVVNTFLHLGYIPEPQTIYQNIYKFPAGHIGTLNKDLVLKTKSYWDIGNKLEAPRILNEYQGKKQLSLLLENAVQKRLISDVPLGAFLSGGTDSSLVTALASKYVTSPLKTFSIGFSENKFDEREYARAVAKQLKTDHTEYILAEKEAIGILETYLHHFDEPFADTSAIPTMLVSRLAREEVKVVLTGDGGDELFQGYGAYTWANRLDSTLWKTLKTPVRLALQTLGKSKWDRVAHLLESDMVGGIRSHIFSQEQYLFTQKEVRDKLLKDRNNFTVFDYKDLIFANQNFTAGEQQALFDLCYYLKDDLLVKVDRASMYYALECRSPLLDNHVVEYAFLIDNSLKIKNGTSKYLLKALLSDYIPQELVHRPKWGFSVPLMKWMKGELRYLINDFLNDEVIEEVGLFNAMYIRRLKQEFSDGKDYLYNRLWAIIVLHKWMKENN